jgi:hypothetical protein
VKGSKPVAVTPSSQQVLAETRAWVDRVVIGLNLCPFAKAVQARDQVRYVVSGATDAGTLLDELRDELDRLASTEAALIDTSLLIHPWVLNDFLDYNDFLGIADEMLAQLGHEGVLQLASFHPQFQFSGTAADDVTNATNQSPYPMLHVLREASVDRAVSAFPEASSIYGKNMRTMEALGAQGIADLLAQCRRDAG